MILTRINHNRYFITSDDKIEVGDYCILFGHGDMLMFGNSPQQYMGADNQHLNSVSKKVIATTYDKNLPPIDFSLLSTEHCAKIGYVDIESTVNAYVDELIECRTVSPHERTWVCAICHMMAEKVMSKYESFERWYVDGWFEQDKFNLRYVSDVSSLNR